MSAPTEAATGAEEVVWDLSDLYHGPDDPALERDLTEPVAKAQDLADRYRGRVADLAAGELAAACAAQEEIWDQLRRASSYAELRLAADTGDEQRGALQSRAQEQVTKAATTLLFFELEWLALDEQAAEAVLADPAVEPYRHHLGALRRHRPHVLSEPEERVASELTQTGASAWARLFDRLVGAIRVQLPEGERSLEEGLSGLFAADRERRRTAQQAVTAALRADLPTRVFLFNTLLQDKAIHDRLRGHPHWLHDRNLANEADDAQVEALIDAVTGAYELVGRYYRLKARLLGLDELTDYDRYAPLPDHGAGPGTVSWQRACELVVGAYGAFSPRMREIVEEFLERGWLDAAVRPGKRAGAFAHPVTPTVHPYILLNYTGSPRDVMTLAHELGHGVHMRLAQSQTLFNADTPLTTAETASIFGETVTLSRLLEAEPDARSRLQLVIQRLDDTIATVFRQVAMNRFEHAVHTARREHGELSTETLAQTWLATQREMFDGAVTLTEEYGCWWSYIPHFIDTPGYVYAYAYGHLLALALYRRYEQHGPEVVPDYLDLLAAGGSRSPDELAARVGVDLGDPGFWEQGLAVIADDIAAAEDLAAALGH